MDNSTRQRLRPAPAGFKDADPNAESHRPLPRACSNAQCMPNLTTHARDPVRFQTNQPRSRPAFAGALLPAALALLVAFGNAACIGNYGAADRPFDPAENPGDWNDVRAAADLAFERAEVAPLRTREGEGFVAYDLLTVQGEPGSLVVLKADARPPLGDDGTRLGADGTRETRGTGDQRITAICRLGRFGEPEREDLLLSVFFGRLADLRGVDAEPIR